MKLLIAVDMEGISGVTNWNHVDPGHAEYSRYRRLMTQDVNAAVQGAISAGADEIVVTDGHSSGDNLLVEELDPRARLNSGSPSPFSMVQGVQDGVDAAFFIGYHARSGTQNAILDHTWSNVRVHDVWLNGRPVGEMGLNAALCGHFGVPVLLVSGDQSLAAEANDWVPGVEVVIVKQASGRFSAELLQAEVAQARIRAGADAVVRRYLKGQVPPPVQVETPLTIRVAYKSSDWADKAAILPGSRRLDGYTVEVTGKDMAEAYQLFRVILS
jgi:D-amino peptidase